MGSMWPSGSHRVGKPLPQLQGVPLWSPEYRFKWVDVENEGSCSGAQDFNDSKLKETIEDGSIAYPKSSPNEPGSPDLPLLHDPFALKTWLMKP